MINSPLLSPVSVSPVFAHAATLYQPASPSPDLPAAPRASDTAPPHFRPTHASRRLRQARAWARQSLPQTSPVQYVEPAEPASALVVPDSNLPVITVQSAVSRQRAGRDNPQFSPLFFPMYEPPYVRRNLPDPTSPSGRSTIAARQAAAFFSRYEPHFCYAVMHFGNEDCLRQALHIAGLQEGSDIQIDHCSEGGSRFLVALFRDRAAARQISPIVMPSAHVQQCIDRLKHDAHSACTRLALQPRLPVPALAADASPSVVISAVLARSQGMVVGEFHHAIGSKRFLIDHIALLKQQGVQTLFMEHLLSDEHQSDLDAWHAAPSGTAMSAVLRTYLRRLDQGHMQEHAVDDALRAQYRRLCAAYSFTTLAEAAQRASIKVVAVDCSASYGVHTSGLASTDETAHTRYEVMNYFASEKIRRRDLPGKWVALVGNAHANTYCGVPGVAEQTGTLAVVVNDKKYLQDQPAVRTRVTDPVHDLKLDIVVTMPY